MNKLEVGMWVRIVTLSGHGSIGRLQKIDNICVTDNGAVDINNIRKFSYNIIDLIEVGDYVNGHKVIEVDLDDIDDYGNNFKYIKTEHDFTLNHWVKENEIETIVIREMFESMEYKVGDSNE